MNITANREQLRAALALATSVADRKSTIPTLACALLRAGKSLTVSASDLSVSYLSEMPCSVKEPGAIALDARGLHDIISSLTADDVTIRAVDGKGEIRAGKARFQLGSQPVEHFPTMPDVDKMNFVNVRAATLARMVDGVAFCCDPLNTNPAVAGVYLGDGVAMGASSARTAMMAAPLGGSLPPMSVPCAALATMLKVAGGAESVEMATSGAEVFLRNERTVVAAKLYEAPFPADLCKSFFRAKSDHEVTVPRVAFADALRRVSLVTSREMSHEVRLSLKPGMASLVSRGASTGIAEDEIAVGYDGKGHECAFSAQFLVDALEAMTGDEVTLGFNDDRPLPSGGTSWEPIIIRPLAEEMGEEHAVVLMTIKH
jgi:DNA polymerase-3 subunit beta